MQIMYVDESGDPGTVNSPTRYFILSAIIIHESKWRDTRSSLVGFRGTLRSTIGLKFKEEIHCTELINKPKGLSRIKRNDRLDIIKKCIDWLNTQSHISVFSVVVDKQGRTDDIFEAAWSALLMRFENTMNHANFNGPSNEQEYGIVLTDNTDGKKLRQIIRRMRHYNHIPNKTNVYSGGSRNLKIQRIIEDPVLRDSKFSFVHQMNDVVAYCARQLFEPNAYMKKKGGTGFYKRLDKVSITAVTTRKDNMGIVLI